MVSALAAVDRLREAGVTPQVPVAVTSFVDEEGARFGIACAGSRMLTGQLAPERALALTDECSLAGAVRAHFAAKEQGLKLIVGTEVRLAEGDKIDVTTGI